MVTSEKGTTVTDRSFEDANHTANVRVCVRRCGRNACGNRVRRRSTKTKGNRSSTVDRNSCGPLPRGETRRANQTNRGDRFDTHAEGDT